MVHRYRLFPVACGGTRLRSTMGLDFRFRDFAYPFSMLRMKKRFERHQYFRPESLERYQLSRLRTIISHAGKNVPYYSGLFASHAFDPLELHSLSDLSRLPFLTKETVATSFARLTARNANCYHPMELATSGTTGGQVRFLVDKPSNILEFVYYWRFWGWHGYRLGNRFAEFSAQHFTPVENHRDTFGDFNPLTNRLLVNSLLLSKGNRPHYIALFKKYKPRFIKGLPSNLYIFALLCSEVQNHGITFRAVFSQGENLFSSQKNFIAEVFSCPVVDSYGHLERTAAISQCPMGTYHVHSDYSIVELVPPQKNIYPPFPLTASQSLYEVVGTSLHNMSMPLIRYKTGDLVIGDSTRQKCPCGRTFPAVHSVIGRDADIVITPDKRAVTALYVALDRLPGIGYGQIIQESLTTLVVRIAGVSRSPQRDALIAGTIHAFTGTAMDIVIKYCSTEELYGGDGIKFKSVVSLVNPETLLG